MTIEIHEVDITDGLNKELFDKLKEENEKLKKQLSIAVKALEWYAQPDESLAKETLEQIKEMK